MSDFKLDLEVKAKWVKELKSGNYKQGHGFLEENKKDGRTCYCCLGVAVTCGLTKRTTSDTEFVRLNFLPMQIQKKLVDLNDETILTHTEDGYVNLHVNDFNKIANWIEENL